jgi:hypothetical protein
MNDLFLAAVRGKFRFSTSQIGELTTEQLFDLPLTSNTGKANLNDIAIGLDDELETLGKKSFVDNRSDPRRGTLTMALEVVKAVIEIKQLEAMEREDAAAKKERNARIRDAIDAAEGRELSQKSVSELKAMIED